MSDLPQQSREQAMPRLYALEQLDTARRGIRQLCEEMPLCRAKVAELLETNKKSARDWYNMLNAQKDLLMDHLEDCRLLLLELGLDALAGYTANFRRAIGGFAVMTPDYGKLTALLTGYLEKLPDSQSVTTNASVIGRLMNSVRMGYYPTDPDHVRLLVRGIAFPPGVTTNLFDPCCGCGTALRTLAMGNNCMTYGAELDAGRAEEAQSRLHRVAVGSYFHAHISSEAFHLLFLNPPYLSVVGENGAKARHEKRFLAESIDKLMPDGLLVYIIPYYRLTPDIARILCDNFRELSVYRFIGKEFDRFSQIAVLGVRKKKANGADRVEALMNATASVAAIPTLDSLPENAYALPDKPKEVPVFKGSVFNRSELARQLAASGSISKLLQKNELDSRARRPLLPLNVGQVGLIGGSGLINGLAVCDNPHIVKGRITKEKQVFREVLKADEYGRPLVTEETETNTNKLTFHILTANGFKALS